jgi:hypothetical protein
METQNALTTVSQDVIKSLNDTVISVLSTKGMEGFERAFLIAEATAKLKNALTPAYMKPIMELQGNRLGFKTDLDSDGGYKEPIVKNCLIEAVLTGVQPFGNQFNIIAGNCYITKEGFGYLLQNFPGLSYEIIPMLPRISMTNEKASAAVVMKISWSINNGETKTREIDFAIRMNKFMGTDAVIGKATRKARAWLFWTISGIEVGDGDATDIDSKVMESKINIPSYEELMALTEKAEPILGKQDFDDARRILSNKEENSYRKLYEKLTSIIAANGNE